MKVLTILVGLAGCGKSTWAKEQNDCVIVSSDEIRREMYGDAAIQMNHNKVFREAHKRVREALSADKDVIFDATNISRKSRRGVIEIGKNLGAKIEAVVFRVPAKVCIAQNMKRERKVPPAAIYGMVKRFEIPLYSEGFDDIKFIGTGSYHAEDFLEKCKNFDQQNHHHIFNLYDHCLAAQDYVYSDIELDIAARYHDIGKLFTKSAPDENDDCHYLGHANYGAYLFLCSHEFNLLSCQLINYHMIPYLNELTKFKKRYENEPNGFWCKLMELHEADLHAH